MFCDLCCQELDGYCEFCDEWYCQTCEAHECESVEDDIDEYVPPEERVYPYGETPFGIALDGGADEVEE